MGIVVIVGGDGAIAKVDIEITSIDEGELEATGFEKGFEVSVVLPVVKVLSENY